MRQVLVWLVAATVISSCLPEDLTGSNPDQNGNSQQNTPSGTLSADLVLTTDSSNNDEFPYAVKATMTGTKGASYTLKVDGNIVETGQLPSVGMRIGGPFSGSEGSTNIRLAYFVIGESGSKNVSLVVEKNGEQAEDAETISASNVCQANENFYSAIVDGDMLGSKFNRCTGCHTQQPDNSTFSTLKNWNKVQNNSDPYLVANTPAEVDLTPAETMTGVTPGGQYNHSDGRKWQPDSATHFRVLEMVYRMRNNFSCP